MTITIVRVSHPIVGCLPYKIVIVSKHAMFKAGGISSVVLIRLQEIEGLGASEAVSHSNIVVPPDPLKRWIDILSNSPRVFNCFLR